MECEVLKATGPMLILISKRNSWFLYRSYVKPSKVPPSWDVLFNPKTPKPQSVKIFRQKLSDLIDNNVDRTSNPQMMISLEFLFQRASVPTKNFRKSLTALYRLILQRRIPDDDIYRAIAQASRENVVNLTVPKEIDRVDRGQQRPFFQIHPGKDEHLGKVLKGIRNNDNAQSKPITRKDLFQEMEGHADSNIQSHIDLDSLQEYLDKAEQGKKQQKYAWEEQKKYRWDCASGDLPKMSAASLLFPGSVKTPRRPMLKMGHRLWRSPSSTGSSYDSRSQQKPKDLLIYNLDKHSKVVIPPTHSNSIFNINYRDLFGVINSSGRAPQEILDIINKLESDGWTLIGDLYDNSENIVFQRASGSSKNNKHTRLSKATAACTLLLFTAMGYIALKPSESSDKSKKYREHL
ncbi:ZYBA0S09-04170g1_1 [Zygosaccharomyces bailii CLIB 213]|uniref:ZYBA0S09-04170g1_1 n=1 Tax=Zygosaccharomyces bailii (strain CLIB 213 / ATCC 58445 / CBS 680 / BCRC 21525 / NBRC 1098 / NCYC 1416 / NRRL Y-2227) TaxID=1333698 RepID=A0A8J2T9B7_ZYGB2|nr:ZYBA0S09-04170g1_1 [Zygosaccharomyces bailii CLIB 213]